MNGKESSEAVFVFSISSLRVLSHNNLYFMDRLFISLCLSIHFFLLSHSSACALWQLLYSI